MNVLCSDKTGTLSEGVVRLQEAVDYEGHPSEKGLFHACLNASFEAGFSNPIDEAIRTRKPFFASRPGRSLLASTILVGCVTLMLPYTPPGRALGFQSLPAGPPHRTSRLSEAPVIPTQPRDRCQSSTGRFFAGSLRTGGSEWHCGVLSRLRRRSGGQTHRRAGSCDRPGSR
jgi:hypothetical protein